MNTIQLIIKTSPLWVPIIACGIAMIINGEW